MATRDNWIIPSSIAFVAQIPWIENATIKENILFGLPLDEERYEKVIEACALKKDLEMLTDGGEHRDWCEWYQFERRTALEECICASIVLSRRNANLDDIFSAVDAHVGRHIFEQGLTGERVGRTRILVTHHVALCKPRTKYIVELGDGTVENSGFVKDLEKTGALRQIITHEESNMETPVSEDATVVDSEGSSDAETGAVLKKVESQKATAKFVQDEGREQGRVKTRIYLDYMKASGGWPFWLVALAAFAFLQVFITGKLGSLPSLSGCLRLYKWRF